jgi:UTP--glucose-1-phosphate uridylyltransferase
MKITTALIAAAGYGTRMLPVTKTIRKEMLPVLNRPFIDYIVRDLIENGIERIIFVVNEEDTQIRDYFSENRRLYDYLVRMKKPEKYAMVKDLHTMARFEFLTQPDIGEYGTAVPVKLAKDLLKDEEAFLYVSGDDLMYREDGISEVEMMIKYFESSGASGLMSCVEVPWDEVSKYGIVEHFEEGGFRYLKRIVEKPKREDAASNLINITKYVFTSKIWEMFDRQLINERIGELLITDTVTMLTEGCKVAVYKTTADHYLDIGTLEGWLKANMIMAKKDPQLAKWMNS